MEAEKPKPTLDQEIDALAETYPQIAAMLRRGASFLK